MLVDRAKAMQRICFDAEPSQADLELLGSPERWLVYRELVQNRLVHVVGVALARTKAAVGDEAFGKTVAEWLSTGGPRTRYLRNVPMELADFGMAIWQSTAAPWVPELARLEITMWKVRHGPPNPEPAAVVEFAFDRSPVVGTAVEVLRLDYPVHRIPTPATGYDPSPTLVCVYRDHEHRAQIRKLNPMAADLLEAWQSGDQSVAESIQRITEAHGTEIGPAFVEKLSAMIADLIERGVILGGRAPAQ